MMGTSELAERILFGTTMEDKLFDGGPLVEDGGAKPIRTTPDAPGRPSQLALDAWHRRKRTRFVDVRAFHSEKERGLVLHFFANHELLALELMALALLKFPNAPAGFRQGLVATLRDEQMHLRLYIQRMEEIGVEFGEIPVSDFFWRAIAPMESPVDFVAGLSLTLEQANLDYAPYYRAVYLRLGDDETASIMGRVYEDEINHVSHGLNWFQTWRDDSHSLWSSYVELLKPPLNPSRAKGISEFNGAGRRAAGLDEDFITKLEVYAMSRGRCPDVYWFNPSCDFHAGHDDPIRTPPRLLLELERDFETLPMFLCARDDVVAVGRRPGTAFLQRLQLAGFHLPEFVELDDASAGTPAMAGRKIHHHIPWGIAPGTDSILTLVGADADNSMALRDQARSSECRQLYSKVWSCELLRDFRDICDESDSWLCEESAVGTTCRAMEAVHTAAAALCDSGFGAIVVKGPFGSAGRDQVHIDCPAALDEVVNDSKERWIRRLLEEFGAVVVEPWVNRVVDLSAQFEVDESGTISTVGLVRFITDRRGQYRGSFVHQKTAGLDEETRRFLYGDGRDSHRLERIFDRLGRYMVEETALGDSCFAGPVGVDAMVYRDRSGALRLNPLVEVNPRFTMSRVALGMAPRVHAARTALWLVLSTRELTEASGGGEAFARDLEQREPIERTGDGQISRGILFTTDPSAASAFSSVLVVSETLAGCRQLLGPLGGVLPTDLFGVAGRDTVAQHEPISSERR